MKIFLLLGIVYSTGLLSACSEPETAQPVGQLAPLGGSAHLAALAPPGDSFSSEIPTDTGAPPQQAAPKETFRSREALVEFAYRYLGVPYVYAASDPEKGFDCSGFINYVYHHFGFEVPRSSIDFKNFGREITLPQVKVGDLLLFTGVQDTDRIGHIGIVTKAAGPDCEFIHASSGKEMAVTTSALNTAHYRKRFVKAIDVISTKNK